MARASHVHTDPKLRSQPCSPDSGCECRGTFSEQGSPVRSTSAQTSCEGEHEDEDGNYKPLGCRDMCAHLEREVVAILEASVMASLHGQAC